ncbi:MAG: DEAD/DEAH box helicase family protein [Bacteroidetes bacterium]|nr:DEAD/DEAH box helicase family protein [Bacteroidota bacterium]
MTFNTNNNNNLIQVSQLWDHQKEALKAILSYLDDEEAHQNQKSCLIHLPPGSGKTGIIAFLTRMIPGINLSLILSPRSGLRDQIFNQVNLEFFKTIKQKDSELLRKVYKWDSYLNLRQIDFDDSVLVGTIQKFHLSMSKNDHQMNKNKEKISLMLIDEGHYEPAYKWRESIRSITAPKIIFTATPFRNDFKLFDIDLKHHYSLSYHKAVKERYIRKVEIIQRPFSLKPNDFVKDVIKNYKDLKRKHKLQEPKVVIRCDNFNSIKSLSKVFENLNESYIAVHENFNGKSETDYCKSNLDKLTEENQNATFWIHQFKILEGIDNPKFQILALYDDFRSAKPLVQQVGRIIRNSDRRQNQTAYFLDHSKNKDQAEMWEEYLKYDQIIEGEGLKEETIAVSDKFFEQFLQQHPDSTYIEKRFRSKFNLQNVDPFKDLLIPSKVNIYTRENQFDIEELKNFVKEEFEKIDRKLKIIKLKNGMDGYVINYINYKNSPYLRNKCFLEPRFGVTLFYAYNDYIIFFDTGQYTPNDIISNNKLKPVKINSLRKLFAENKSDLITSLSLKNSHLGRSVYRTKSFSAFSVDDTVPSMDDHAQICTIAEGVIKRSPEEFNRRYIGFRNSRVNDRMGQYLSLGEYIDWTKEILNIITKNRIPARVFKRYAARNTKSIKPTPRNILLDIDDIIGKFRTAGGDGVVSNETIIIDNLCHEIKNDSFSIKANGKDVLVKIHYERKQNKYKLYSNELDRMYVSVDRFSFPSVTASLNTNQSFRILPESENIIYAYGEFYQPPLKVGKNLFNEEKENYLISQILNPDIIFSKINSEKGKKCKADHTGWEDRSLFELIRTLGKGSGISKSLGKPDLIICDDMGAEIADFIVVYDNSDNTKPSKIALIHAKASREKLSDKAGVSATNLQDVCSQATKNLNYISLFNELEPSKIDGWNGTWTDGDNHVTGYVDKRVFHYGDMKWKGLTTKEIWARINSITKNPYTDREVWLYLGNILSENNFWDKISQEKPNRFAIQAAYKLHETLTSIASVGGKLRVFCSP